MLSLKDKAEINIDTRPVNGDWLIGKTDAAIRFNGLRAIDSNNAWYLYNMKSKTGHTIAFGGLGDSIGFYTFLKDRTANGTDSSFVCNTATGNWTCNKKISATGGFGGNSDSATQLKSLGDHTEAASGTTGSSPYEGLKQGSKQGLYLTGVYGSNTNAPANYGNIINIIGRGTGQLFCPWPGSDNRTENPWYRCHRDTDSGGWGPWKKMAFADDVPTREIVTIYNTIGNGSSVTSSEKWTDKPIRNFYAATTTGGSKLSYNLSEGKIIIGSGVSKVLVSLYCPMAGLDIQFGVKILKNGSTVVGTYERSTPYSGSYSMPDQWKARSIPNFLLDVAEGDYIQGGIYFGQPGDINIRDTAFLTVEVIK